MRFYIISLTEVRCNPRGEISLDDVRKAFRPETRLVVLSKMRGADMHVLCSKADALQFSHPGGMVNFASGAKAESGPYLGPPFVFNNRNTSV